MKNKINLLLILLFFFGIILSGCNNIDSLSKEDLNGISDKIVSCDKPYIKNGLNCCLDKNSNHICDKDELNNNDNGNNNNSNTNNYNNNNNTSNSNNSDNNLNNNSNNNNNNFNSDGDKYLNLSLSAISNAIFSKVNEDELLNKSIDEIIEENTNTSLDSDRDGIPDSVEISGELGYVTDPKNNDTDGDGLTDLREYWWLCNPTKKDTNGDFIEDGISVNQRKALPYKIDVGSDTILGSSDMDGDLLPNAVELYELHLNPNKYSSDGDRYGDGQEYFKLDSVTDSSRFPLPSYVKADPYNPAVPDIAVRVKPEIKLIYDKTYVEGNENKESEIVRKSSTKTFQQAVTATLGAKVSTTVSISSNPLNMETGAKVEAYAGVESQTSFTFTGEKYSANENSNEKFSRTETDYSNTKLRMWLEIENIGNDILRSELKEITVNYYLGNDKKPFASQELSTSITNLKPGDVVSLTQTDITLTFDEFLRILDGEGITVKLEHFSFGDDQIYLENSKASGIRVLVSDENSVKQNFIIPWKDYTIKDVLNELNYSYKFENNRLVSLNGKKEILTKPYKTWSILITRYNSDHIDIAKKLEDTKLKAGDSLVIKYRIDTDGDGLSDEYENMIGTDINNIDTDGDGLTDGYSFSIKNGSKIINYTGELTVGSNPLLKDSDFDFVTDDKEIEFNTDPTDPNSYPNVAFIYEFDKFRGNSMEVIGEKDLSKTFNDKISSLIIPKGLAVILYDKKDKTGDNAVFFGSVSKMDFFDNKASAIKVVKIEDLPKFELIRQHTITKSDYLNKRIKDSCLLLDVKSPKDYQALAFDCEVIQDSIVNIAKSPYNRNSDSFYYKQKDEIYWKFERSKGDWLHLVNIGSSRLNNNNNICLMQNIEQPNNEEVTALKCNNREFDTYLNWKIVPQSGGWISLINEGSSVDRNKDTCLWMEISSVMSSEVQGYNCDEVKEPYKILWKIKLV